MHLALLSVVLMGCASAMPAPGPGYEYGGLRQPAEFMPQVEQAQPVVPPPAKLDEPQKEDPCIDLCATLKEANEECGSLIASCNRYPTTDNDVCRAKKKACSEADIAQRRASKCSC